MKNLTNGNDDSRTTRVRIGIMGGLAPRVATVSPGSR